MFSLWRAQQGTGRMQSYGMRGERKRFENCMKMTNFVTLQPRLITPRSLAVGSVARPKSIPDVVTASTLKISQQVTFYLSFLK
jgi:hypothetical protein